MRSFVVVGDVDRFTEYVVTFCEKYDISPHERYFFDGVKIRDARSVKRILASAAHGRRVIVLSGNITVPAQNALLKSIEEHDSDTYIVFSVPFKDALLPTILSRCSLIHLTVSHPEVDSRLLSFLGDFARDGRLDSLLRLSSHLTSGAVDDRVCMYALSEFFSRTQHQASLLRVYRFAQLYLRDLPLLTTHHINRKYFFDTALFEAKNTT